MNQNKNETQKTRFYYQLKSYGLKNFFISADFVIAFAFLVVMLIDNYLDLNIFSGANDSYVVAIFAVAATLFAITLTALAILLSFSNTGFVEFLRKNDKFSKFLFIFWSGNAAYLLVITFSVIYFLLTSGQFDSFMRNIIYPLLVSLFIYAIINTFYLLGAIIRFGYFIDIFEREKNK